MKKVWGRTLIAAALVLAAAFPAYAGWQQDQTGWWYERQDGSWPIQEWIQDGTGTWYYFSEDGYMLANTVTPDGCKVGPTGALSKDSQIPPVSKLSEMTRKRMQHLICYLDYFEDGNITLATMPEDNRIQLLWMYMTNCSDFAGIPIQHQDGVYKATENDADRWLRAMIGRGLLGHDWILQEEQMEYRDGYFYAHGGDWGMSWPEARILSFERVFGEEYEVRGISGWKDDDGDGGWSDYEYHTFTAALRYTGNPYMQGLTLTKISFQ